MTDLDDDDLTDAMNAAAAPKKVLTVVEDVTRELNSGYGDTMSGTAPYKDILGASFEGEFYDAAKNEVFAKIDVNAEQQSPYGDNANTKRSFVISRADAHELAEAGPQKYRGTFTGIAGTLDAKYTAYEEQRIAGIRDTVKQMAQLANPVSAPQAARFTKRR